MKRMTTTIHRPVIKRCPFRDETDYGELKIIIPGIAPELYELAEKIDRICAMPISHENFTTSVHVLLPEGSEVLTSWQTGPWAVDVEVGDE